MADMHYTRGNRYFNDGNYENAIAEFTSSLRVSQDLSGFERARSHVMNRRGEVFVAMGNYNNAIADFIVALRLDPNNTEVNANLARAVARQSNGIYPDYEDAQSWHGAQASFSDTERVLGKALRVAGLASLRTRLG